MNEVKKVLLIGVTDVINGSVIESNVDSKLLSKTIIIAQETGLKPILGTTLYAQVIDAVYNYSQSGETIADNISNLIEVSKPYLIAKTTCDFVTINNFKFTNKGILKLNDDSATALELADLESVKDYYNNLIGSYKADLIQYLKDNQLINYNNDVKINSGGGGWFTGRRTPREHILQDENYIHEYITYSASSIVGNTSFTYEQVDALKNVLLISDTEIKANSVIEDNVDSALLTRTIKTVQDVYLKPILGENIYYQTLNGVYQNQVNNAALAPLYSDLLTIIKPYLINKVVPELIIPNQYKFTNKGLLKLNDNSATALGNSDVESIKQYYENISTNYKAAIVDYLLKNHLSNGSTDTRIGSTGSGWFTGKKRFNHRDCFIEESNTLIPSTYVDTFTTGGTYSNGIILLKDNQGRVYEIDGLYTGSTDNDIYLTGGTYTAGVINLYDNSGNTISIEGLYTGSTGGTITQGLQDVITANNTLTQNNYIDSNGFSLEIGNTNGFYIDSYINNDTVFQLFPDGSLQLYGVVDGNNQGTLHIDNLGNFTINSNFLGYDSNENTLELTQSGNFSISSNGGDSSGQSFQETFNIDIYGGVSFYSNIFGTQGNTFYLSQYGELQLFGTNDSGGENYYNTLQLDNHGQFTLNSIIDDNNYETFSIDVTGQLELFGVVNGVSNQTLSISQYGELQLNGSPNNDAYFNTSFQVNHDGSFYFQNTQYDDVIFQMDSIGNVNFYAIGADTQNQTLQLNNDGSFFLYGVVDDNNTDLINVLNTGDFTLYGDGGSNNIDFYQPTFTIDRYGELQLYATNNDSQNQTLDISTNGDLFVYGSTDGTNYNQTFAITKYGELEMYGVEGQRTTYIDQLGNLSLYGSLDGVTYFQTFRQNGDGSFNIYSNNSTSSNQTLSLDSNGAFTIYGVGIDTDTYVATFELDRQGDFNLFSNLEGIQNQTFGVDREGTLTLYGDADFGDGTGFALTFEVDSNGQLSLFSNIEGTPNESLSVDEFGQMDLNLFDGSSWDNVLHIGSTIVTLSSINNGDIDISSVGNLLLNANNASPYGTITINAGNKINLQSINGATFTDSKSLTFIANSITGFTLNNAGVVSTTKDIIVNGLPIGKGNNSISNNIAIGVDTLKGNNSGNGGNIAIGLSALTNNTTGYANTAIGQIALSANTTGIANTALGYNAMKNNTIGQFNTAVGVQSQYSTNSGSYNTSLGHQSLFTNTTGQQNSAFGTYALNSNTVGQYNMGMGYFSLYTNVSGSSNVAIGVTALGAIGTNNSNNIGIGFGAGHAAHGNNSVYIGHQSGNSGGGDGNIFIGYQAGLNETGNNKLYISNSSTSTPLIGGDFTANTVTINGSLTSTSTVTATKFQLSALNTAPASSTDTGTTGEIRVVNGFIYVCVATNTWQRSTLSTF